MDKYGLTKKTQGRAFKMKIEFVEFYPIDFKTMGFNRKKMKNKRNRELIGTVHLYLVDEELDIRGIRVFKTKNNLFFHFPYFNAIDAETKEKVGYPHIRFTNQRKHEELLSFLSERVKPEILKRVNQNL